MASLAYIFSVACVLSGDHGIQLARADFTDQLEVHMKEFEEQLVSARIPLCSIHVTHSRASGVLTWRR